MNWKKEIKKPRAKKMPPCKKQETNDKHEDGGIDDAPTDIITIPEIVDLMIKSIDEKSFVIALQDVGKQITTTKGKKKVLETVFPEMKTFVSTMRKAGWEPFNKKQKALPEFLKKMNITRVRDDIASFLILKRKKVNLKNVFHSIREIFVENVSKDSKEMYALFPEQPELQGLRSLLVTYFEGKLISYEDITNNHSLNTPNDAARLAAIMLDENNRPALTDWLKNKKSRAAQDQGTKPTQGLFEDLVKIFNDPSYVAMEPEDTGGLEWDPPINPNDVSFANVFFNNNNLITNQPLISFIHYSLQD
jgi:hypothetical protein